MCEIFVIRLSISFLSILNIIHIIWKYQILLLLPENSQVKASRSAEQNLSRKMLGLDNAPIEPKPGFFSKHLKVALAALGGLGALAGAYLVCDLEKNYWF